MAFTTDLWDDHGFPRCVCGLVVDEIVLASVSSCICNLSRELARNARSSKFAFFSSLQFLHVLWRIERSKTLVTILLRAYSSHTSLQWSVFVGSSSAYWERHTWRLRKALYLGFRFSNDLVGPLLLQEEVKYLWVGSAIYSLTICRSALFFCSTFSTKSCAEYCRGGLVHEKTKQLHGCAFLYPIGIKI